jgi:Putative phage serine protease XkdF
VTETRIAKRLTFDVRKRDDEKMQLFGFASVVEKDGPDGRRLPVVDLQNDIIDPAALEKAAYSYVARSGRVTDMHKKAGVGHCIESVFLDPQKCEAMGIKDFPATAWWVGIQCTDPETWQMIKAQRRPMLSIGGVATKRVVSI